MKKLFRLLVILLTILGVLMGTGLAYADVDPPEVTATLAPGESLQVTKTVDVPAAPPKADVYFLADTTGSMGSVIANVQANASTVLSTIQGMITDVRFGAGQYKDFPFDSFAFSNDAPIGLDDGLGGAFDASDAIAAWSAGGGADGSEGQLFALDRIADPTDPTGISWRSDTSRILVWFGDAPGHDPVCSAISSLGFDITETTATTKLVNAGITVVAISTTTGFFSGMDDDPTSSASNYASMCIINGTAGQATRIATATGGVHLTGVGPADIVTEILAGIEAITFDITAEAVGCDPLDVSFDPPLHEDVVGPTTVQFEEMIEVPLDVMAGDLPPDGVIHCMVEFKASGAVIGVQNLWITVPLEMEVVIDIKPGSDPNSINCNNDRGVIAVAILTTAKFDATTVDHTTVRFEGASETHVNKKTRMAQRHEEDVDGDGDIDVVFHFRLKETDLTCDSTEGTLTGETFDGQTITDTDAVRMIERGGGKP